MSLYNMVMGINPYGPGLMALLGIDPRMVPRLRDCYVDVEAKQVVVLTRTGGGNRLGYAEENAWMESRPGFVKTEDDDYDSTFAKFWYAVDAKDADIIDEVAKAQGPFDPMKRFQALVEEMGSANPSPAAQEALAKGKAMLKPVFDAIRDNTEGNIAILDEDKVK